MMLGGFVTFWHPDSGVPNVTRLSLSDQTQVCVLGDHTDVLTRLQDLLVTIPGEEAAADRYYATRPRVEE